MIHCLTELSESIAIFLLFFIVAPPPNIKPAPIEHKPCKIDVFHRTLLVLSFNLPFYNNIPRLHAMYDGVFGKVLTCGPPAKKDYTGDPPDILFDVNRGGCMLPGCYSFHCMGIAMQKYPDYDGEFRFGRISKF